MARDTVGYRAAQQRIREDAAAESAPPNAAFNLIRGLFGQVDVLRRAQGNLVGAFGLNPSECVYRIIASGPYWRLRDYGNDATSRSVLIVAAPIKRPYIWDLTPSTSAIRYCLEAHLHVHLLEWLPASPGTGNNGLDEYARDFQLYRAVIGRRPRRKAISDRALPWRHSCGNILRLRPCKCSRARAP